MLQPRWSGANGSGNGHAELSGARRPDLCDRAVQQQSARCLFAGLDLYSRRGVQRLVHHHHLPREQSHAGDLPCVVQRSDGERLHPGRSAVRQRAWSQIVRFKRNTTPVPRQKRSFPGGGASGAAPDVSRRRVDGPQAILIRLEREFPGTPIFTGMDARLMLRRSQLFLLTSWLNSS